MTNNSISNPLEFNSGAQRYADVFLHTPEVSSKERGDATSTSTAPQHWRYAVALPLSQKVQQDRRFNRTEGSTGGGDAIGRYDIHGKSVLLRLFSGFISTRSHVSGVVPSRSYCFALYW